MKKSRLEIQKLFTNKICCKIKIFYFSFLDIADGLCCQLKEACPKIRPIVQFRELEIARESVKLIKKLGSGCFGDVHAGN